MSPFSTWGRYSCKTTCFLKLSVALAIIEDKSTGIKNLWSWGSNKFGQLGQGLQEKINKLVYKLKIGLIVSFIIALNNVGLIKFKNPVSTSGHATINYTTTNNKVNHT